MDDKEKAFEHFDAVRQLLGEEQAAITALAAQGQDTTELQAKHTALHERLQQAWADLLEAEGWTEDAREANRSGGENKPPQGGEQPGGGG